MLTKGTAAYLAMMLLACEAPDKLVSVEAENGEPATFYAADAAGIVEGTPEALGVLAVANTLSRDDLDYKVGLTSTAANNIASYRKGADGIAGTADDKRFASLAELDAVPYVGTAALSQLLTYARANGYVRSASIFDPSWQTGTKITASQISARFAPGATRAEVGKFAIAMRNRSCNSISGCTSWNYPAPNFAWMTYQLWIPGPGWSPQKSCFQFETASFPAVSGTAAFVIAGTKVDLSLESSPIGSTRCADIAGSTGCSNFQTSTVRPTGGRDCSLPNPAGSGAYPDVYPVSVPLYDPSSSTGSPIVFNPLVTAEYAYALSSSKSNTDASGSYREVQYALYVSLDGKAIPGTGAPTCTPTTCSAKGAACGTVEDGCGGTLNCGSCGYPYRCDTNKCVVPPGCNLQPCGSGASVGYTCCSPGQTTCGGIHGCTCYDACH